MHEALLDYCDMSWDPSGDIDEYSHGEWSTNRIQRDEGDVQKIIEFVFHNDNPFDNSIETNGLRNIVSGVIANEEVTSFLLSVKPMGEEMYDKFKT